MHILPILHALRRHRLTSLLLVAEIALACAVLCNAGALIAARWTALRVDSGVDEASLAAIRLQGFDADDAGDINARVLQTVRAVAGVQSISIINTVPFGPTVANAGITTDADGRHFAGVVDFYVGAPGSFEALGLHVVAGRAPTADDAQPVHAFVPDEASVQIPRVLARHLWPGEDPLGKTFWVGKRRFHVVGVLDHLSVPGPGGGEEKDADWSVFVTGVPGPQFAGSYLLRAAPDALPRVLSASLAALRQAMPDVVIDEPYSRPLTELRQAYFEKDRFMAGLLLGVMAALLMVTALGIVGLASFWVQQRTRSIGVRRAIGATRRDILRYFQIENFIIVGAGVTLGLGLAVALNLALMQVYELQRLPWVYLPPTGLGLLLLGQLSVLAPAARAAQVSPATATRSI
ncbi:ABC transporter permease [Solimonas marina]|uniref:FtsX-like permease family protein n=1 Tax=Solimonas marina TaxID=2714601 RepID=A0A970BA40_9GAMM|nr:FtsX-like permease family protein [Solimonas marina]NKF23994.1 FtsX-like permease family protein [Solimonas marina]